MPSLYVFQGVPSCMVMTTSALLYNDMGADIKSFTFWTSLVCLPWSFKPLWAPLVERYSTKLEWVRRTQILLVLAFVLLGLSMVTPVFYPVSLAMMLVVAFASSCHDIACDGYYMMALDERGQSFFVGIRSTFYRVAMVATTGLVPLIAGSVAESQGTAVGWATALCCAGALLAVMAILCRWGMPRIAEQTGRQDNSLSIFVRALKSFFTHPGMAAAVTYFCTYRLGEAILSKMILPFLNSDRDVGGLGIGVGECGLIYGTFGVLALVVGGILGGIFVSRVGLRRAMWPMTILMNVPNLAYVALAYWQPASDSLWVPAAVMTEQFGYGFGFTAYMLMMIHYVGEAEYKAAEYAIGSSIMSLSLILPGMASGWVYEVLFGTSYLNVFLAACVLTLPGIVAAGALWRNLGTERAA